MFHEVSDPHPTPEGRRRRDLVIAMLPRIREQLAQYRDEGRVGLPAIIVCDLYDRAGLLVAKEVGVPGRVVGEKLALGDRTGQTPTMAVVASRDDVVEVLAGIFPGCQPDLGERILATGGGVIPALVVADGVVGGLVVRPT